MPSACDLRIPSRHTAAPQLEIALPVLETPRLRLRPLHSGDTPWLEELLCDDDVRRYTLQPTRSRLRAWLEAPCHVAAPQRWAIDERRGGPCGWISLGGMEELDTLSLGFELRQRFWNRGIMTEAVRRLVDHHFVQQPQEPLGAIVFEENYASRRVLEKSGFAETGHGDCQGHPAVFFELQLRQYRQLAPMAFAVKI